MFLLTCINDVIGQSYFYLNGGGSFGKYELDPLACSGGNQYCTLTEIGTYQNYDFPFRHTITPGGKVLAINTSIVNLHAIIEFDTNTGDNSIFANLPNPNNSQTSYGGVCAISESEILTHFTTGAFHFFA